MSGRLVLMGSGELAPTMVGVHRDGIAASGADEVVVIDSPFGFQENVRQLTDRICEFFRTSFDIPAVVASYRRRGAGEATKERFRAVLGDGRYVFAGPGSPSYALGRWDEAAAGPILKQVVVGGGTVTLASAAALTAGVATIPVYEMYKVGHDPFWLEGLDLTAPFGFSFAAVPHWNNREGGDHDTSHCYIGARRFDVLRAELDVGVVGVDEHTAAVFDFDAGVLGVSGVGGVSIEGHETVRLESGDTMTMDRLADLVGGSVGRPTMEVPMPTPSRGVSEALAARDPDALLGAILELEAASRDDAGARAELRTALARTVEAARTGLSDPRRVVGGFVDHLLQLRADARDSQDYQRADAIRDRLVGEGIAIHDTPEGTTWSVGAP